MNEVVYSGNKLYEVLYRKRGWALAVFFLTMYLCGVSNQALLDIYDLKNYPGQNEAEAVGLMTYFTVRAFERAFEFMLLALFVCSDSTKNVLFRMPRRYRHLLDCFLVCLFFSPLLLVLDVANIVVFSYLIELLGGDNRVGIGVVLIVIALLYYASIYIAASALFNKRMTLMLFIGFMLSIVFSDFVLFGFVDKVIGIVD